MIYSVADFVRQTMMGYNETDAFKDLPFSVIGDATDAFNKWKDSYKHEMTEMAENKFMLDYLEKMARNAPGVGYSIMLDEPRQDTRVRPWKFTSVPGYRKLSKKVLEDIIQVIGHDRDGKTYLFGEVRGHFKNAMKIARQAYADGFKGHIEGRHVFRVPEGIEDGCFEGDYCPSKWANEGVWICFGMAYKTKVDK